MSGAVVKQLESMSRQRVSDMLSNPKPTCDWVRQACDEGLDSLQDTVADKVTKNDMVHGWRLPDTVYLCDVLRSATNEYREMDAIWFYDFAYWKDEDRKEWAALDIGLKCWCVKKRAINTRGVEEIHGLVDEWLAGLDEPAFDGRYIPPTFPYNPSLFSGPSDFSLDAARISKAIKSMGGDCVFPVAAQCEMGDIDSRFARSLNVHLVELLTGQCDVLDLTSGGAQ